MEVLSRMLSTARAHVVTRSSRLERDVKSHQTPFVVYGCERFSGNWARSGLRKNDVYAQMNSSFEIYFPSD